MSRPGRLRFYVGVMGSGKSALALQLAHHRRAAGRPGMLFTGRDRTRESRLTSRLGIHADARPFDERTELAALATAELPPRGYVIVDEAQFLTPVQVDALALAVDEDGLDVDCFGLMTAFDASIFPGSLRLVELADETVPLQVEVVCWCGRAGLVNARIEGGTVVRRGGRVAVGDVDGVGDGDGVPRAVSEALA